MQALAAYVAFVAITIILIFSVVVVASVSIAICEAAKWLGRTYAEAAAQGKHARVTNK